VKRKLFRKLIDIADHVNIWFRDTFNLDPKKKLLERRQDILTMRQLDATIGKALGARQHKKNL
jgi:hypothetical protein